jgi:hypothetical protein
MLVLRIDNGVCGLYCMSQIYCFQLFSISPLYLKSEILKEFRRKKVRLVFVRLVPANKILKTGRVPVNKFLKDGWVPANMMLNTGWVPVNKFLKAGGVPANNLFL